MAYGALLSANKDQEEGEPHPGSLEVQFGEHDSPRVALVQAAHLSEYRQNASSDYPCDNHR